MKRVYLLLFIALCLFFPALSFAAELAQFRGKVIDASTHSPLAGATIYITDLKVVTTTNSQGEFTLRNVPSKGKFLLEVRFIGYKTHSETVDLSTESNLSISLFPS